MTVYAITEVYVSSQMAEELINNHGCRWTPSAFRMGKPTLIDSQFWNVKENCMARTYNTVAAPQDDLARELLLIPTIEARLEYLNSI